MLDNNDAVAIVDKWQIEQQMLAQAFCWLLHIQAKPIPTWVQRSANNVHTVEGHKVLEKLKREMKTLKGKVPSHSGDSRSVHCHLLLMKWWGDEQTAHKERLRKSRAERRQERLVTSALAKLTKAEREALGFS